MLPPYAMESRVVSALCTVLHNFYFCPLYIGFNKGQVNEHQVTFIIQTAYQGQLA